MSKQLFAVNKTESHLILKQGYLRIDRGSYRKIQEDDLKHPDFVHAQDRDWIEVTDKEPKAAAVPPVEAIEFVAPVQGLTIEELRAEQAKDAAKAKPVATGTPIGRPVEEPEAEAETVETEAAPKKAGRKAATEKTE